MRIALCWNQAIRLGQISVRYDLYARGFRRLGHDVITICLRDAAEGYSEPVHLVESPRDFADRNLYASLGIDVVVMVTWLQMNEELAAARMAGCRIVAITDSDGQIGVRVHPMHQLGRMITQHTALAAKMAATKFFLERYLIGARREDEQTIGSIRHADVLVFNTNAAVECFSRFLLANGQAALRSRLVVTSYPVDDLFCNRPVTPSREASGGIPSRSRPRRPRTPVGGSRSCSPRRTRIG